MVKHIAWISIMKYVNVYHFSLCWNILIELITTSLWRQSIAGGMIVLRTKKFWIMKIVCKARYLTKNYIHFRTDISPAAMLENPCLIFHIMVVVAFADILNFIDL